MIPLVEFPELVQHYSPFFEEVFSAQAFIQFERYISGLIVSENKTVEGINRWFVQESRNQSSLNRLLNESPFSLDDLNRARLKVLEGLPETRMKPKGVLSVDDTLLSHYGQHFDEIAYLYDPVQKGFTWAHNLVTLHYSDDQTDYPVHFQLWKPADLERLERGLQEAGIRVKESKQALKQTAPDKWRQYLISLWRRKQKQPKVADLYESKLKIAEQLVSEWVQAHPNLKLPVAFDNWYTQPDFCHFLDQELDLPYVGTLSAKDQVVLRRGKLRLDQFAQRLKQEHLAALQKGKPGIFKPIGFGFKGTRERYCDGGAVTSQLLRDPSYS